MILLIQIKKGASSDAPKYLSCYLFPLQWLRPKNVDKKGVYNNLDYKILFHVRFIFFRLPTPLFIRGQSKKYATRLWFKVN